ncbi:MAG: MaoC family dehydratase [Hyphomicrobiales bacterium]
MSATIKSLSDLEGRVGEELGVSRWYLLDQARIDAFAKVTDDEQFIHLDPERTRAETPFDGTIAHGFLTMSLLSSMSYEVMPFMKGDERMGINYGFNKLRFISPVPSGSRVRGRFSLVSFDQSNKGFSDLILTSTVEIEGQSKPALVAEWINRQYTV